MILRFVYCLADLFLFVGLFVVLGCSGAVLNLDILFISCQIVDVVVFDLFSDVRVLCGLLFNVCLDLLFVLFLIWFV